MKQYIVKPIQRPDIIKGKCFWNETWAVIRPGDGLVCFESRKLDECRKKCERLNTIAEERTKV